MSSLLRQILFCCAARGEQFSIPSTQDYKFDYFFPVRKHFPAFPFNSGNKSWINFNSFTRRKLSRCLLLDADVNILAIYKLLFNVSGCNLPTFLSHALFANADAATTETGKIDLCKKEQKLKSITSWKEFTLSLSTQLVIPETGL